MSSPGDDVYGGNYPKAKGLAFARSSGKCQFCGLREADEAHHWAYYNYPSGADVQGHDLTALCKTCHELATTMRNWMAQDGADIDFLRREIEQCRNRTEKREAISYWFYPEADDELHQDDFGDGEPMGHSYFIDQQLASFEEPEIIAPEPPTPKPDSWSTVGSTLGSKFAKTNQTGLPTSFFFWVFIVPGALFVFVLVMTMLTHRGGGG
ncbi:MAG: hypothetical protein OXF50_23590 [Caldilineaceae bacterium]|nr:hypothetical protein [Caldilineaceae bacterium]